MKVRGKAKRVKLVYKEWIEIPEPFKKFVWSSLDGKAPLEEIIVKVLTYGKFEDIKRLYQMFPEESYDVAMRYPDIKRGVRYLVTPPYDLAIHILTQVLGLLPYFLCFFVVVGCDFICIFILMWFLNFYKWFHVVTVGT